MASKVFKRKTLSVKIDISEGDLDLVVRNMQFGVGNIKSLLEKQYQDGLRGKSKSEAFNELGALAKKDPTMKGFRNFARRMSNANQDLLTRTKIPPSIISILLENQIRIEYINSRIPFTGRKTRKINGQAVTEWQYKKHRMAKTHADFKSEFVNQYGRQTGRRIEMIAAALRNPTKRSIPVFVQNLSTVNNLKYNPNVGYSPYHQVQNKKNVRYLGAFGKKLVEANATVPTKDFAWPFFQFDNQAINQIRSAYRDFFQAEFVRMVKQGANK